VHRLAAVIDKMKRNQARRQARKFAIENGTALPAEDAGDSPGAVASTSLIGDQPAKIRKGDGTTRVCGSAFAGMRRWERG
jgi:hypothetical protein